MKPTPEDLAYAVYRFNSGTCTFEDFVADTTLLPYWSSIADKYPRQADQLWREQRGVPGEPAFIFSKLPEWLQQAAHTDPLVNYYLSEWRATMDSPVEFYERLAKRLFEVKTALFDEAVRRAELATSPSCMLTADLYEKLKPKAP